MALGTGIVLGAVAAALLAPAQAVADGPVVPNLVYGGSGVSDPTGTVRYVTLAGEGYSTILAKIDAASGEVMQSRAFPGGWGITAVTADGVADGLSGDGHTLVLGEQPQLQGRNGPHTRFAVYGTLKLKRQSVITVPGWVGLDAISPDGLTLYLIQSSPRDLLDYKVRAYDIRRRQLLPRPIVDAKEPDEKMQGIAMARVWSADRATAYTLYSNRTGGAFIHALHTDSRTADCIDVPTWASQAGLGGLMLADDGKLDLTEPTGAVIATVDPLSREVTAWQPKPLPAARPSPAHLESGGRQSLPLLPALGVLGAVGIALIAAAVTVRRRPAAR
jgi:hypothetical protein